MVRAGLLLLLVLSVVFVAGQYIIKEVIIPPRHDPSYVSSPPGEIVNLQLSKLLSICKLGGCTTVYKADVDVWGFQNFDSNVGLLLALKGSWVTAWSSKCVETNTVTTFSLSTNTTREDLIAIAIPLWRGSEQWIQSLEVAGFDQYCTMELRAPKIREVKEDWINEKTV